MKTDTKLAQITKDAMTQVLWDNYSKGCGHFEWGVASFRNMPETTIVLEGKMDRLRLFTHGTLPKVTEKSSPYHS